MRKFIVAGALVALSAFTAGAAHAQGVEFGIKAGANLSKFGGSDSELGGVKPSNLTGYSFGSFVNFGLGPMISLQPELLYTQRGSKYNAGGADTSIKIGYVDVPVLVVVRPPAAGLKPYALAGPVFSYRADCSVEAAAEGVSVSAGCDDDDFKKTDVGLALGAGVGFPLGMGTLLFDGRYGLGLTKLAEGDEDVKNRGFAFSIGYAMRFGF